MVQKECFKCGVIKTIDEFYKHKMMSDGYLNKCKTCVKKDVKERETKLRDNPLWLDNERARGREKYHRLGYSNKANPEANKRWLKKFPEKGKAKRMSGKMVPPQQGLERHHWNYNEEYNKDVIWLSKKDHMKAHRFIVYDQERMMYRTTDNMLLDTKERHFLYISDKIKNQPD